MSFLSGLKNCVAFLTIIPVGMSADGIRQAASYMPIFPVIGAIVGLLAGAFVWTIELVLPSTVAGVLGLGLILLVNGVQHLDGLLDFGDGLMFHGSREGKLRVMRDPQTGAGGLSLGIVILLTTGLGIASIQRSSVLPALIVSESAAKFSMVSDAWIGKSAHKGMNTSFVNAMHGARRNLKILSSFILMVCVSVPLLGLVGLIAALVAVLVSTVIVAIADRNFGGITGDVMGATNEITRLFTILTILGAAHWA